MILFSLDAAELCGSEVYVQSEVTAASAKGADQWHFSKGTACLLLKWHLLSVYTLSYALSLASLWHFPSREVNRYLKFRSLSLSHSKKSIQVSGDSPVCPLVTAGRHTVGVSWPSSLSSLFIWTSCVPPSVVIVQLTSDLWFSSHSSLNKQYVLK